MRLLILTQKVDAADSVLGFFHAWIVEFARQCETVTVICLYEGAHTLPENVRVFSLGKEKKEFQISNFKFQIFKKIIHGVRFLKYIWKLRKTYDAVFVHMNPEYVVLGGLFWRLFRKKIGLWYVHRNIDAKLKIAEKLADIVFSTTPEAFRLKSAKVYFLGHGIDFSHFEQKKDVEFHRPLHILHVGRITPIKNIEILVDAVAMLKEIHRTDVFVTCVGEPVYDADKIYFEKLQKRIKEKKLYPFFSFIGPVSYQDIPRYYREADISVNLTPTGGMDKTVLESVASGTIALSANHSFKDLFGKYADILLYHERDAEDTANKIMYVMDMGDTQKREIEDYLYERAKKNFNLSNLIKQIVAEF